jgi:ribosomal protein L32
MKWWDAIAPLGIKAEQLRKRRANADARRKAAAATCSGCGGYLHESHDCPTCRVLSSSDSNNSQE